MSERCNRQCHLGAIEIFGETSISEEANREGFFFFSFFSLPYGLFLILAFRPRGARRARVEERIESSSRGGGGGVLTRPRPSFPPSSLFNNKLGNGLVQGCWPPLRFFNAPLPSSLHPSLPARSVVQSGLARERKCKNYRTTDDFRTKIFGFSAIFPL